MLLLATMTMEVTFLLRSSTAKCPNDGQTAFFFGGRWACTNYCFHHSLFNFFLIHFTGTSHIITMSWTSTSHTVLPLCRCWCWTQYYFVETLMTSRMKSQMDQRATCWPTASCCGCRNACSAPQPTSCWWLVIILSGQFPNMDPQTACWEDFALCWWSTRPQLTSVDMITTCR